MNLKIVNVNTTGFRINLKDKNLIDLFDKLESNPQECSKETAWAIIKSMGGSYKDQIDKLHNTDLDFLYVVKDTSKNCFYVNCPIMRNLKLDIDNLFNNDAITFKNISYALSVVEYYDIVIYAII